MSNRERELRGRRQARAIHKAYFFALSEPKTMAFFEGLRAHGRTPAQRVRIFENTRPA
jgi:hypothetical protein